MLQPGHLAARGCTLCFPIGTIQGNEPVGAMNSDEHDHRQEMSNCVYSPAKSIVSLVSNSHPYRIGNTEHNRNGGNNYELWSPHYLGMCLPVALSTIKGWDDIGMTVTYSIANVLRN